MRPTRVLVCGATGFIGRNLATALCRRADLDVTAVFHRQPPFVLDHLAWRQGDLRSPSDAARLVDGMDVVIQAAAATSGAGDTVRAPHLHVTDNAVMNSVLLRAVHDAHVGRFLFFSCSIMYSPRAEPVRETDFTPGDALLDPYFGAAWTKVYIEQMCEFYARLGRTRCTIVRHANVYGPYDKFDLQRSHVFGATITKVLEGEGPIVVWGDGSEGRDLIHVDDLARFVEAALDRKGPPCEVFNVGSGTLVSVADLVHRIRRLAQVDRAIEFDRRAPTINVSVCLDSRKAYEALGWRPDVALDDGIVRTLGWRRAQLRTTTEESVDVSA